MNPIVSIIIPCFNSGKFLPDALDSIKEYHDQEAIEIIIVDDGSKDEETLSFLSHLSRDRYVVIHQENKGPAAARNTGAIASKSEYLLFLDSDNKIRAEYIDIGIGILKKNETVGVVYGNAAFFGETVEPRFKSKPLDIFTLLMGNYIDVCSVVRKKSFEDVNGFDEARILFGHEDWELWIRIYLNGWKFYYVDQTLFDYRVRGNSLLMQKSEADNLKAVLRFVHAKHPDLFIQHQELLQYQYKFYQRDQEMPFRTFIKSIYRKYLGKEKGISK